MRRGYWTTLIIVTALLLSAIPAHADHTNPREQLASTDGDPAGEALVRGEGTWELIQNFKANPGTDIEFFKIRKSIYASAGTLGQANAEHVGQRIFRLVTRKGLVKPKWIADHGSASCPTENPSGTTGLQHDVQITPRLGLGKPKILIDTTDATGRCHDAGGGGLELVDISRVNKPKFEPRELALTRHVGTSHTVTVDDKRPWIVYSSNAGFTATAWIEVLNIKSCLLPKKMPLEKKREKCRPKVYRIMFQPGWSSQTTNDGSEIKENTDAACHDITSKGFLLYCAGLNATLIFDTKKMTNAKGEVKGDPLQCEVIDGRDTTAKVTDCSQPIEGDVPQATGWVHLGSFNHVGRDCGGGQVTCNNNIFVPSAEGIAVAHEADPTPDGNYMFVTDERGGGIVPGGASCDPGNSNPYSNGGVHMFDISDPATIQYALQPDDTKAVYITDPVLPANTFCTAHVMELIPNEQRFVIAWYSQGVKIVDWFFDANGRVTFREIASFTAPGANTWVAEDFKIVDNEDGTRTYYFLTNDISRGQDVLSWTGPPNPIGSPPPAVARATSSAVENVVKGLAERSVLLEI